VGIGEHIKAARLDRYSIADRFIGKVAQWLGYACCRLHPICLGW
jgi:hypothetical protein